MSADRGWEVHDFEFTLDAWAAIEQPPDDLLIIINVWGLSLFDNPYVAGARRAEGFEDLWHAVIPGTFDGTRAVACSYFINAIDKVVRCTLFGYQAPPITY